MSQPFIGEIRMFGGNFPPVGWAFCDGQLMAIADNDTLFNLIGTTYGGDGQTTFALPDLRGRIPIHMGQGPGFSNRILGELAGAETVTLTVQQIPIHNHVPLVLSSPGILANPQDAFPAAHRDHASFAAVAPPGAAMKQQSSISGGSQPHDNMPPYAVVSFIISLFGIFPSQT